MPSFDVVSEVDMHEATNAVDQANREVSTRFDFKGTNAHFELAESQVSLTAAADFQLRQMIDILHGRLSKRGIDIGCLEALEPEIFAKEARQVILIRQGLETPLAKKLVKTIKDAKLKVQTAIQGEKVRISGKKRDDLQRVIALLKKSDAEMPLQYINFRD